MVRYIKKLILLAVMGGALLMPAFVPVAVSAQIDSGVCEGANLTLNSTPPAGNSCARGSVSDINTNNRVNDTIKLVVNVMTLIVGLTAVIMIIVGGLKYITSGGDSSKTASAKDTILFAIIGLVVVMMAQVVVRYVIARAPK